MQEKREEKLLREFEWARDHIASEDVPQPDPNVFKMNLDRMEEERKKYDMEDKAGIRRNKVF